MQFDYRFANSKTQSGTYHFALAGALRLLKAIKDSRNFFGSNTQTLILHTYLGKIVNPSGSNGYCATLPGKFQGISTEIDYDTLKQFFISIQDKLSRNKNKSNLLLFGRAPERVLAGLKKIGDGNSLLLDLQHTGARLLEVEQIGD